ncbi:MAG TPA: LacI family DNA-binding transcriptional regulator [Anaerohalosphaeraceae bacterium]|nr:LacI family DNA-binding transcriptional regulator [Phycisphaerae bacterium]HOK94999.1 LacI family DNA-binding transcriptional regulator [Anaerohalosphaeraceae bacterium]HOL30421.1 LacI family DNA-binding transcriptional regulator [Anaerohalosphaeraceae bacterium]HOM75693.1 LacI family DNA-binding transcriptional regulator [Anaerohalosphaeraceae bacterium]HPC64179.1 LacI family DNA-binding transcriptional regulator [Anaerohalosphaeraceae bacterium]
MAKKRSVPTVREIASHCGVSVATVSRVLNRKYTNGFSVRQELHNHITKVADELGYRPNLAAKNLVQRQTMTVAILGCNTVFGWPSNIYQNTSEAAIRLLQSRGYNVCITAPNLERDNTELPPWRVDGVLVLQECSPETIDEMERIDVPYVVVNGKGGPSCSSVVPDDIHAARRAVEHLLGLGHRRIAYAGPTPQHRSHASVADRHQTYLSELRIRGLEPIAGHNEQFISGLDYLVSVVLKQKATAIVAYDHVIALKILHDAHILNIDIPRQVSLICFNDEYLCDMVMPPLTTIGVPSRQMGQIAAEMLLRQMEAAPGERPAEHIRVQQELVVRSSTAEPIR